MAWLVRDTTVLASVEIADSFGARLRGLLGRAGLDGALLLRPARSVHTVGMRFPIDVAFCDGDLRVLHVTTLRRNRVARPIRGAYVIIEAEAGAFERWHLAPGDQLAVHGGGEPPRRPVRQLRVPVATALARPRRRPRPAVATSSRPAAARPARVVWAARPARGGLAARPGCAVHRATSGA